MSYGVGEFGTGVYGMGPAATKTQARELWPDARSIEDDTLDLLLESAWEACAAFLPLAELEAALTWSSLPAAWVEANVLQARDGWAAFRRDGDVVGFDSYAVRVRPLSDAVRARLRPTTGRGTVG